MSGKLGGNTSPVISRCMSSAKSPAVSEVHLLITVRLQLSKMQVWEIYTSLTLWLRW